MANTEDKSWVTRALASGLLKWLAFQAATLGGPILIGFATMAVSRLGEGAPWMWSIAASSLAFGGAAAGVYYSLGVLARYRVDGMLNLVAPRIAAEMSTGDLSLGITLQNSADVPVEFEVKSIRTNIAESYSANKAFARTIYVIPAHGQGWFSDFVIPNSKRSAGEAPVSGSIVATIAYGRPGARKYELNIKCGVHLKLSASGAVEAAAWELSA